MALPRSPLGLNQWRLQWLTARRGHRPKAVPSASCRCPGPASRRGCHRQRSPDPPAHAGRWRRPAAASGAVDLPTQSASVERSRSRPSRSKIWLCRYSGKWSASPGLTRPHWGHGPLRLVDQHMRQQTGSRPATLDQPRRQRCLREAIAAGTGQPWPPRPAQPDKSWFCVRMHAGRFTMSSHCPPLVRGQWRGAGDVFQLLGPFVGKTFHWKVF